MIDDVTGKRIQIKGDGIAGPYIIVPGSQASKVRDLFNTSGVFFTENANSVKGRHDSDTVFDLGPGTNVDTIQSILDGAA